VTLAGVNTYTGDTVISGGTQALVGAGSIATSNQVNLTAAAGTFDISGTTAGATITTLAGIANSHVTLGAQTLTLSNASTTYAGVIQGTGGLTIAGGTQVLTGANTYSGGTVISGATLNVNADAALGATSGSVTLNGGTFQLGASLNTDAARKFVLNTTANTIYTNGFNGTIGGQVTGTGGFTKVGTGTLALSGTNTYSGGTVISAGTLNVNADAALGATSGGVILNGGTFQLGASLNTDAARTFTLDATTNTIDTNGFNGTIFGQVKGAGGFTKVGAGTLTLSAANTYAGGTTISAGTLALSGAGTLGAATNSTVITGGTLDLGTTTQTPAR